MKRVWLALMLCVLLVAFIVYKAYNTPTHSEPRAKPTTIKAEPDTIARVNKNLSLRYIMDSLHIPASSIRLLVIKSKYELSVWYKGKEIKNYPVALGINPKDDKLIQGDRCTPEGIFHIKAKYPSDKWEKFMWLDYPNAGSWKKYNSAVKAGKIKRGTDIGGEVGIHGVPAQYNYSIGPGHHWTWGCVCLTFEDVNDLYTCVDHNTVVEIRKK